MSYKIPKATVKRLPFYRRCFENLDEQGIDRIMSRDLGDILKIDPATIRRDFSYIGELGRQGYGYEVTKVLSALNEFLDLNNSSKCIVVGVGNLGRAFSQYIAMKSSQKNYMGPIRITHAFDIKEEIIGTEIAEGVKIHHIDELEQIIKENGIKIAVLSVPGKVANDIAEKLESNGIKGIFNFSSTSLNVSRDVFVHDVDLLNEMQSFLFFTKNNYSK
ncbi:redox-sensing transcriptional repressor Rex [Haloplasma contractile]|uniref:Redox-sensing transcriptional repressor Rex n=1 Tax=Haloplasma contractile SSD-17B TaxID=1033810 RepID=U2FKR8_9MOLU|nr:redox-sensing transcriptional repressor Rex [Haloplasma contractile]ERJ13385.1 Redox-sensing transcriptional repressor rex protein [Haloplasma contractile SSD-17B]